MMNNTYRRPQSNMARPPLWIRLLMLFVILCCLGGACLFGYVVGVQEACLWAGTEVTARVIDRTRGMVTIEYTCRGKLYRQTLDFVGGNNTDSENILRRDLEVGEQVKAKVLPSMPTRYEILADRTGNYNVDHSSWLVSVFFLVLSGWCWNVAMVVGRNKSSGREA